MNEMMNDMINENAYRNLIDESINKVHLAGIATKILQHMDRVRNVSDLSQARRWVMELLQNARDVAYEEQSVKVRICLTENRLTFSHNGRPFRVKDILSIINQVSSKGGDENSVGKFGTGFVSTFQLSEKVEIHSVLQEKELPYKRFQVTLDRAGRDNEQILAAISHAMEELRDVDCAAPVENFEKDAYNTEFLYHLETEESRKAARVGMEDLQHSVFYILLFSKKLREITLEYDVAGEKESVSYRRMGNDVQCISEGSLQCMNFEMRCKKSTREAREQFSLIYMTQGDITLAAGYQKEQGFVKLSSFTPRLFVDFPLIGAEEFPFPMVIDSRSFRTNEPRSGITLVDNVTSQDALVNKALMDKAVEIYGGFLRKAIENNLQGIENILFIPPWQENREMSQTWVEEHIYKSLFEIISKEAFLEAKGQKYALAQAGVCVVAEEDEQVRKQMTELLSAIPGLILPAEEKDWYGALENYFMPEEKCWTLEKLLKKAEEKIKEVNSEPLQWLQKLYNLGIGQEKSNLQIRTGSVRILPNQSSWEERNLYTVPELKRDPHLPEILKDVSEELDVLQASNLSEPLCIRKQLLHKEFNGGEIPELGDFERAKLESYLTERTNRNFRVQSYNFNAWKYDNAWRNAWMKMLSCGPDKEFYQLGKALWKEELPEYKPCEGNWNVSLWKHSYIGLTEIVINAITISENLENLCRTYFEDEEQGIAWLNVAMKKCREYYLLAMNSKNIYLNQKGCFCIGAGIRRDGTKNDVLKDIAEVFIDRDSSCDFRERLLDRRIDTREWQLYDVTEEMIAQRLNQVLQQILREQNLADTSMKYQMACTRLLQWMNENEALTERYFPAFADEADKVRLMTPAAVITLQKKSAVMDKVLEEAGVKSLEELSEFLEELSEAKKQEAENYSLDGEVYCGDECRDYEEEERQRILREIGIAGEKYAWEQVKQYFVEKKYAILEEEDNKVTLHQSGGARAILWYGDVGEFHQPGWDIKVTVNPSEGKEVSYYVEVKTHTLRSIHRDEVTLSTEQMKLAVKEGEHYAVLSVDYDFSNRCCVGCSFYLNPLKCFAEENRLKGQDKYVFYKKTVMI